MSITLNTSDFQFLQDQLVELKNKNYELAEKNRRGQADFEAAKAKICGLQLKLEEQERDFQVTSTTLRREIEAVTTTTATETKSDEDYKLKYKKVLVKAKDIQQRYEKLEEENARLVETIAKRELDITKKEIDIAEKESDFETRLKNDKCPQLESDLESATRELDQLRAKLENQAEEKRIHERKGLQIVKELKRQLNQEKSRADTLQKRLEELLSETTANIASDIETTPEDPLSTSSSTNGNSNSSNCNGSWSFVPPKCKQGSGAPNETMSLCSIDSEDRETVQHPGKTASEDSMQRNASITSDKSRQDKLSQDGDSNNINPKQAESPAPSIKSNQSVVASTSTCLYPDNNSEALLLQEQAALVDRLTKMQHDKWMLEEKLSYLEQANCALSEDLANKSNVIRSYFLNQAQKSTDLSDQVSARRTSIPSNFNHILTAKPNLKKVVDFLKERATDSDAVSKEATKKMQLMLEETLIKCIKLQENLDFVTGLCIKYGWTCLTLKDCRLSSLCESNLTFVNHVS